MLARHRRDPTYHLRFAWLSCALVLVGCTSERAAGPKKLFTLEVSAGPHGRVQPSEGSFAKGTTVELTATPDPDHHVEAWSGTIDDSSKALVNRVVMDQDRSVTVTFAADYWSVSETPVIGIHTQPSWGRWKTDPFVMRTGNRLVMYFGCNDIGSTTQICRATSDDGAAFALDTSRPAIRVGPGGAWDDKDIETPWVLHDPDAPPAQAYKMWYAARGAAGDNRPDWTYQIGYATSPDGVRWTKYNDPRNDADARFAESDPVLPIPAFTCSETDCMPVPSATLYDAWTTGEPSVVREPDGQLRLYYIGLGLDSLDSLRFEHRVALATSGDGVSWTRREVVFEADHGSGEKTGIMCPAVTRFRGKYWLFYTMVDLPFEEFANIEQGRTGVAVSSDGSSFTRIANNPIIGHGPPGSYYASGAFAATPFVENNALQVFFSGLRYEPPALFQPTIGRAWLHD